MKYIRHFLIRVVTSKRHRGHHENYYLRVDQIINYKGCNRFSLDAKHMLYFFGNVQTAVYKFIVAMSSSYSVADEASKDKKKKMYLFCVNNRYTCTVYTTYAHHASVYFGTLKLWM